jgi:hypothetical protein
MRTCRLTNRCTGRLTVGSLRTATVANRQAPVSSDVRPHSMSAHVANAWSRIEAVRKARAIFAGDLGVLEGCILLSSLAHNVVPDWRVDPDFVVFGAVASETGHLPLGSVRTQWSSEALARADLEIERYTEAVKEGVLVACRNIIERFGDAGAELPRHDGAV